jgi:cytochrome c oxidase subunit 4
MAAHHAHGKGAHGPGSHHITPFSVYIKVAAALFALTFLTVIAHHFNATLGPLAGPVAFLIATVKAVLVMLFFMHLKYDNNMNRIIFGAGFFFLFLLYLFSEIDLLTRIFQTSTL